MALTLQDCLSLLLLWFALSLTSSFESPLMASSAPQDHSRIRRSSAPAWFTDCRTGLECLDEVLTFTTYRFPFQTIGLTDLLLGRFAERNELRLRLQEARLKSEARIHAAQMETLRRQVELDQATLAAEQATFDTTAAVRYAHTLKRTGLLSYIP